MKYFLFFAYLLLVKCISFTVESARSLCLVPTVASVHRPTTAAYVRTIIYCRWIYKLFSHFVSQSVAMFPIAQLAIKTTFVKYAGQATI